MTLSFQIGRLPISKSLIQSRLQMSLKFKIFGLNVITKILIPKGISNYKETLIVNVLHNMYSFVRQLHNIPKYIVHPQSIASVQTAAIHEIQVT